MSSGETRVLHWRRLEEAYGASPIHETFGLDLTVLDEGSVEVTFGGGADVENRHGTIAGGIIALLVDSAAVQACRSALPEGSRAVTVEMKVNFVRSAGPGGQLRAAGTVEHLGRSLAVGQGRVHDSTGALVAVGLVTVRVDRPEARA